MLDNLKLGYGGTKSEMERLLKDAEKISGVKYDVSSYSDIVDAIHVVQTEMHISGLSAEEAAEKVRKGEMTQEEAFKAMGTTAKEASTTIQGSLQSAKSAWQNLLTGLSDDKADIEGLINNFFDSVVTVGENIIPRIGVVLNGITGMIEKLAPKITAKLPGIFKQILPSVVKGATSLLTAFISILPELVKTITKSLPDFIASFKTVFKGIVDSLPSLVKTLVSALPTLIPQVVSGIVDMVVYLMKHISEIIQPIIDKLPDIIISIVNALMDNLPSLIDGLISLILGIGIGWLGSRVTLHKHLRV
jgi:phage-related protein